jgi:predicted GNAT family N-acyltransferase
MLVEKIEFGSKAYLDALQLRHETLRKPIGLDIFAEDLSAERSQIHLGLFTPDHELVACVSAVPLSATHAKVRQMAVAPAQQRHGFGTRILRCLESHLARDGFLHISMHARITAVPFYERLGYSAIGAPFTEVGIPHIELRKILVSPAPVASDPFI